MNKKEMKHFEKLLREEEQRIRDAMGRHEKETLYQPPSDSNPIDLTSYAEAGTDNNEREVALRLAGDEAERLREVAEALERIKDGTYGECLGCKEPIPKKRLEAFPAAKYCVACKSKLERDGYL
ncbi:MAG TPA: TraR/DksA C4-type zinc finger protein [Candidatus Hydrogenedentes bacterium]|nr:TraR/DksA C4-type zinc finger protein [Candidatus Hydrogenedentota bacterium]HOL78014.1 TraR/DksA C4-type zinc finger protein [Candidatus Hydrogenedentota bacterium]HPO87066.1 TraR/DksA C4-type zinc finger protein [Candidatus Hydrogenedentota bacterium]